MNLPDRLVGITVFDNAGKGPVRSADNSPVASGVFHAGGDHCDRVPGTFVLLKRRTDRFAVHQRRVSIDDQNVAAAKSLQKGARLQNSVSGAEQLALEDGFTPCAEVGAQGFPAVPGNGVDISDAGALHGVEHPVDHRLEKNFRHDGWPGGFHPFPFARGKDDGAAVILHENGPFPETMHFDYPILCQDCACFSSLSLFRNCNCEKIDRWTGDLKGNAKGFYQRNPLSLRRQPRPRRRQTWPCGGRAALFSLVY